MEEVGNHDETTPQPEKPVEEPDSEEPSPEADAWPKTATSLPEARQITRARARDFRALLGKYINRHLPPTTPEKPSTEAPTRLVGSYARALPLLRLIPWTLGLLFVVSFLWDFPGLSLSLFDYTLPLDGLLRIVSVSGLIGFFTNWLAITMLFQPRASRPIFGQGLIPAQRERVIFRLAKAVSEELINEKIIKQKIEESGVIPKYREVALSVTRGVLEDADFRQDVKLLTADYVQQVLGSEEVRQKIADFLVEKVEEHAGTGISGLALKMYRFVNESDFRMRVDRAVNELPASLDLVMDEMDHLLDRVPGKIEARSGEIEDWATKIILGFVENLDVYSMIISNMRQYDEQKLENLLKNASNEQLNYIKYLGGVLGFFGGLIIWRPLLSLGVFAGLGLVLFLIDELLLRTQRKAETSR